LKKCGVILYGIAVIFVCFYSFRLPHYNWDRIAYAACTLSLENNDPQWVHEQAYKTVAQSVPPQRYNELVSAMPRLASDPQAFSAKLKFFYTRPLYILLIYSLYQAGIPLVQAMASVSIAGFIIIAFLILIWLSRYFSGSSLGFLALLFLLVVQVRDLAMIQTPDAVSVALVLMSFYFILECRRGVAGLTILVISILFRFENLLLLLMMTVYLTYFAPSRHAIKKKDCLIFLAVSGFMYFIQNYLSAGIRWQHMFNNAYVNRGDHFIPPDTPIHLTDYLSVVLLEIVRLLVDVEFVSVTPIFLFIGIFTMFSYYRKGKMDDVFFHMILIALLNMAFRFLILPSWDGRYFIINHFIILIAFTRLYAHPLMTEVKSSNLHS